MGMHGYIHTEEIEEYLYCSERWRESESRRKKIDVNEAETLHRQWFALQSFELPPKPKKPKVNKNKKTKIKYWLIGYLVLQALLIIQSIIALTNPTVIYLMLFMVCAWLAWNNKKEIIQYFSEKDPLHWLAKKWKKNQKNALILLLIGFVLLIGMGPKIIYSLPLYILLLLAFIKFRKRKAHWSWFNDHDMYQQQMEEYHQALEERQQKQEQMESMKEQLLSKITQPHFPFIEFITVEDKEQEYQITLVDDDIQWRYDDEEDKLIITMDRSQETLPYYVPRAQPYHLIRLFAQIILLQRYFNENQVEGQIIYKNHTTPYYVNDKTETTQKTIKFFEQTLQTEQRRFHPYLLPL
ncbi:hypothetical protein [Laceyella putida]|uniref:Uncharacterized protein n=1 Tax=Laceyella putida TaxID=110101 RepID=A0ABW2RJY4_9BACL